MTMRRQKFALGALPIRARGFGFQLLSWLLVVWLAPTWQPLTQAQDVKIWEFSPYNVTIWYSIDPGVNISALARERFLNQLETSLERTFRATWTTRLAQLPPHLEESIHGGLESISIQGLKESELVLVTSLDNEQSKNIRTFEAAVKGLTEISTTVEAQKKLQTAVARWNLDANSMSGKLLSKLTVNEEGMDSIQAQLQSNVIPAALIGRVHLESVSVESRPLLTPLPWQSADVFRKTDKLFFLTLGAHGDDLVFKVRELDCSMQFLGPTFEAKTTSPSSAARTASELVTQAFAPAARVEDAQSRSAQLRLRAGGLIVDAQNPALVKVGDVMRPIVRRDDRNGIPTLLEPLSWTYAAITESDGIKMNANLYAHSGAPGWGRKNRRTRRILLKVRPRFDNTDIQISVRGAEGTVQSGCFVYERDLVTDTFEYLGRTDWRGRLNISVPDDFGAFLPEHIRRQRFEADRAAADAVKTAAAASSSETGSAEDPTPSNASEAIVAETNESHGAADPAAIPLNHPLKLIYIKNGETVLAKLPFVPGLKRVEEAFLADDRLRLQVEAIVKGFQGEILDLVGMRNLLAAQVQLYLKEAQEDADNRESRLQQADQTLTKLQRLGTYNEMALRLEEIQRDLLDENLANTTLSTRNKIDRMFKTTRNLLQIYLQDDLLGKTTSSVNQALGRSGSGNANAASGSSSGSSGG